MSEKDFKILVVQRGLRRSSYPERVYSADIKLKYLFFAEHFKPSLEKVRKKGIDFELVNRRQLQKKIWKDDFDLIITHNENIIDYQLAFLIAKLRNKPVVLVSEDWKWSKRKHGPLSKLLFFPQKFIQENADFYLVEGKKHVEFFEGKGISKEKIFQAIPKEPLLISKEKFVDKEKLIRKNLGIENKKVVLFVGRLIKRKNVDILIKAFEKLKKRLPDTALIIVGKGSERKKLMELVQKLKLEDVHFTGFIADADNTLLSYYKMCNVLVLPAKQEPFGKTLAEALSFGKPLISTTDVGASFDLIDKGKNGFVIKELNSKNLFKAMEKILSNPEIEKKMQVEARKKLEKLLKMPGFNECIQTIVEKVKGEMV